MTEEAENLVTKKNVSFLFSSCRAHVPIAVDLLPPLVGGASIILFFLAAICFRETLVSGFKKNRVLISINHRISPDIGVNDSLFPAEQCLGWRFQCSMKHVHF